jgi:hypothetical protein
VYISVNAKVGYYTGLHHSALTFTRFQKFYFLWANSKATDFYKHDLYNFYYDQSHFIKELKNFTGGYSPFHNKFRLFVKGYFEI